MKYVRTKDGRIVGFEPKTKDLDLIKYLSQFANYQGEYAPIAQADTIEELCDEFVVVSYSTNKVMYQTKDYNYFWSIAKKSYINHSTIRNEHYGAIWVFDSSGAPTLKSVAKMNDKGELEYIDDIKNKPFAIDNNELKTNMKGLEALERIKDGNGISYKDLTKCFDIIEKELKEKEKFEELVNMDLDLFMKAVDIKGLIEDYQKFKKALEIIKNKGVFVHLLQQSQNVEEYNSLMLIAFKKMAERDYKGAVEKFCLTQEEYDLLKEILL